MEKVRKNFKKILFATAVCTAGLGCVFLLNGAAHTNAYADGDTVIDLSDPTALNWVSGTNAALQESAAVYTYSYTQSSSTLMYYSPSELDRPINDSYADWHFAAEDIVVYSVIYRTEDGPSTRYSVELASADAYTIQGGYSNNSTLARGRYVAEVTINAKDGYTFNWGNGSNTSRGISVTLSNNNKTASVRKTWYLLEWNNALLSEQEETDTSPKAYEFNSWEFGKKEEVPEMPRLYHGDEVYWTKGDGRNSHEGYSLKYGGTSIITWSAWQLAEIAPEWDIMHNGTQDIVTFSLLRRNGEVDPDGKGDIDPIEANIPRSQWSYYINEYMPVGEYTIEFTVKDIVLSKHYAWWNDATYGDISNDYLYRGFTVSYDFDVTPATFEIQDGGFKQDKHKARDITELNEKGFFSVIGDVQFSKYATITAGDETAGYWAEGDNYALYYDESPTVKFNLARSYDNAYYEADDAHWNGVFTEPGLFHVFYQAEAKNYKPLHEGTDKYEHWFEVTLYRTLVVPTLAKTEYTYTGSGFAVVFADDVPAEEQKYYTVTGNDQFEANEDGEEYTVTIVLNDKSGLYRWADAETEAEQTGDIFLAYHVSKAQEGWREEVGVIPWVHAGYTPDANRFTGVSDSGTPVYFTVAQDINGVKTPFGGLELMAAENGVISNENHRNALRNLNAGLYYVQAKVGASKNFTGVESEWVPFSVGRAVNRWLETPRAIAWYYNDYDPSVHGLFGEAAYGTTTFRIYKLNAAGEREGDGYAEITQFAPATDRSYNNVPAGSYEMDVETDGGDNYSPLKATVSFEIKCGKNAWVIVPSITSWLRGETAGKIVGQAKFGTPVYKVQTADGRIVYDSSKDAAAVLQSLSAGNYTLVATVPAPAGGNFDALPAYEVKFNVMAQRTNKWSVMPNIQGWTEGETPNAPVGAALFGEVKFTYAAANGDSLGAEAPTEAGTYKLIAEVAVYTDPVSDEQYDPLRAEITFTIAAKPILANSWKTIPSIQNWTEGETASVPVGEAQAGNAPIFTYTRENGEALSAQPTQAGSYYLVATVNANGYATLTARVPFKILPTPAKVTNRVQDLNGNLLDFLAEGVPAGSALAVSVLSNLGDSAAFWQYNVNAIAGVGCSVGAMYDISLTDGNGIAVQPNGKVTVTITIPGELRSKAGLQVAHVGELGEVTLLGGSVQGDKITFTTEHFSTFCLIWADAQDKTNSAGAIFLTVIIEVLIVAALASAAYVGYLIYKRSKNKPVTDGGADDASNGKKGSLSKKLKGDTVEPVLPEIIYDDSKDKN